MKIAMRSFRLVVVAVAIWTSVSLAQPFPESMQPDDLDGRNGFTIEGVFEHAGDIFYYGQRLGVKVTIVGDVNGDGVDDLALGARGPVADDWSNGSSGYTYIVFGRWDIGHCDQITTSDIDPSRGFRINGIGFTGRSYVVGPGGDFNGDGYDDIIIGADGVTPPGRLWAGAVYVVFGGPTVGAGGTVELADLNGVNGVTIYGAHELGNLGWSVEIMGDVNGDGIDDIAAGAPFVNAGGIFDSGSVYVVFGRRDFSSTPIIDLALLDGTDGYGIGGVDPQDTIGFWVGSGDYNNDGVIDVAVGGRRGDPGGVTDAGHGFACFGGEDVGASGSVSLADLDGSGGFAIEGVEEEQFLGWSGSGVGDFNHDGIDDFVVGQRQGSVYVIYGQEGQRSFNDMSVSDIDGLNGVQLLLWSELASPKSVAALGDVNFDGRDDLVVGFGGDVVFFGLDGSETPSLINAQDSTGDEGGFYFQCNGGPAGGGGDVNDDGVNDMVFGDPKWPFGTTGPEQRGIVYVVFGRRPYVLGDADDDGALTLSDYEAFTACVTGPTDGDAGTKGGDKPLYAPECERMDFNLDGDVDLSDFQRFQWAITRW